jgi:hypothetical protein
MGFADALKRLINRILGRGETVPCSCCGAQISRSDFDEGRAAIVARVRYCPKCVLEVIGRNAGGGVTDRSSSSIHSAPA